MPLSISPRRQRRGPLALAMLALFGLVIPAGVFAAKPPPPPPVTIQILNVSDWHGNVDPVANKGGAWNLSARFAEDRLAYPTLTLTAGDDFGATPALSSFFNEEPAVRAQRMMGIQVGALGNHNWDRNNAHLQEMINLAGAPTDGANPGTPYSYVAANLKNLAGNLSGVEPFKMFNVGGAKVAVIGITNEEAPGLVFPGAFGTIQITDGVEAANLWAAKARKAGANAVLVITHKGLRGFVDNDPAQPFGELIDFANGLTPGLVDVVFGDHTDIQYSGIHNGVLVHENRSFGVTYAKTLLTVQPKKGGTVQSKSVTFVDPSAGALQNTSTDCPATGYCDEALVDMLIPYRQQLAQLLDGKIATTTVPFDRGGNIERRQEVPLGDLIADGMKWRYGTQLGFFTGGGIRSQLPACSYLPVDTTLNRANWNSAKTAVVTCAGYGGVAPYDIVLGDVFTVLPFGNTLNTRTVTGHQIWTALENGVSLIDSSGNGGAGRFPQISGFKFTFDYSIPSGCSGPSGTGNDIIWSECDGPGRVKSVALSNGTPILDDNTTYTMALPNFINLGGDGYFMFKDGQGATQELDAVVMAAYLEAFPVQDPASYVLDRITKCGPCP